jgi:hypothetical protein
MNNLNIKDTRYCKKCNKNLPKTLEYFPHRKSDKSGFGLYCKVCINKDKREKRSELRKLWDKGGVIEGQEGRKCTICKNIYPPTHDYFGVHKGNSLNLDTYCKICRKEKGRANYNKNKESWNKTHNKTKLEKINKIQEIKKQSKGCSKCNEKRHYLLDFHHLDPSQKLFQIGQGESKGWDKVLEEMKKCILLCKNCHTEFHYQEKTQNINIQEYLKS